MGKRERRDWREALKAVKNDINTGVDGPSPTSEAPSSPKKTRASPASPRPKKSPGRRFLDKVRPTNLPPNPGAHAPDLSDQPGRSRAKPAAKTTPADLKGPEAVAYVARHIDLAELDDTGSVPASLHKSLADDIARSLTLGAQILTETPSPDEGGYFVGFDFGTSSSKIVIRQQGAGDHAYALDVPEALRVQEQGQRPQHLWSSTVWFDGKTGRFSLWPSDGAAPLKGFKTGLIQTSGHRMSGGITHSQAAVAYLALLIAYIVGEHRRHPPNGFKLGEHFSRFHFGVPVACKHEPGCADEFQRVLRAAFEAAPFADNLDLETVKTCLEDARAETGQSDDPPFVVFEELAGVIAGYKASPDHSQGPHVIVDVGASTLDVATFHIPSDDESTPVFMSAVGLLGADALRQARAKNVPDLTFKAACEEHTRHVLWMTFINKNPSFLPQNGVNKPLLYVGGGRLGDLHRSLYSKYPNWLQAPLRTPTPGGKLQCDPNTDFARLLLAWGLSQDETELPELKPPSEIEDYVQRVRDPEDCFVGKEMC